MTRFSVTIEVPPIVADVLLKACEDNETKKVLICPDTLWPGFEGKFVSAVLMEEGVGSAEVQARE